MAKIRLTTDTLLSQSAEMSTLQNEYDTLFSGVSGMLSDLNGNWSANLAHNFSGKISSAQSSFSNIVEMLGNGASAAANNANQFNELDSRLAKVMDGSSGDGGSGSSGSTASGSGSTDSSDSLERVYDQLLEELEKYSKGSGFLGKISALVEILSGENGFSEILSKFSKLSIFDKISTLKDIQELKEAYENHDAQGVVEFGEKYIKKVVKEITSPIINPIVFDVAWQTGTNITEGIESAASSGSIAGILQGIWHATGGAILDTGYNYAKDVVSAFGGDLDAEYQAETGISGGEEAVTAGLVEIGKFVKDFGFDGLKDVVSSLIPDPVEEAGDIVGGLGGLLIKAGGLAGASIARMAN